MNHATATQHFVKLFLLFFALMTIHFSVYTSLYALSPERVPNRSVTAQISPVPIIDALLENVESGQQDILVTDTVSTGQTAHPTSGTATIRSFVWEDTDLDGIQLSNFGENPIPGVTVTLYHSNGLIAGIRTAHVDGYSEFLNLAAGSYYLSFQFPRGLVPTRQHSGDDSAVDSDIDQITGFTALFTVEDGADIQSLDAGFTHAGSIVSTVWSDQNLNGIRDSGEPGVPATVVTLYNDNDEIVQSVPTDGDGHFEFPLVTPGMYTLGFSPPPGMSFTQQGVQSSALNSEVDPQTGLTSSVQITAGPNNFDWGAGLVILVPTALETIAEPTLPTELNERSIMNLFMPFIGFENQP